MNEITYDPNEKIDKWTFEESELRKAFRERKEFKEKCENLQSKIDKAIDKIEDIKMMAEFGNCKANMILNEVQEILEEDK